MSIVMQINPFDFFTDTNGTALDAGYIYIGQVNLDPRIYPVSIYYDEALTIPAVQPLRTSNGYIVRNGSPTFLYINGNYSIMVRDSRGRQVYYIPDALLIGNSAAASIGDITNASDPTKGAGLVGFTQNGAGAVPRTVRDKLVEYVTVTDYGAVGDGTDSATAFVTAEAAQDQVIHVPPGDFLVNLTQSNAAQILSLLDRIKVDGSLMISVPTGFINLTEQVVCNSPDLNRISIVGQAPVTKTATSVASVTGSAKAYSVTFNVPDAVGISVGDYAAVTEVNGTGDYYAHTGFWRVSATTASTVTVLNTHHAAAFPTNTVTTARITVLKSGFQFTGCDGFRFESAQGFARFDRLSLVGDYSVSAATGTEGAHGIIVCAPVITNGGDSNINYVPQGNVVAGPNLGVSGFGEQGIAVSGRGHMIANFVLSSSNRKRGWYAEGGHIRAKFGTASGNGEDGYISDVGGAIQAGLCISVGNGLNGFWCFNNSVLIAATSRATGNGTNGYECRGPGRLEAGAARSIGNGGAGYAATFGGAIAATSSEASENGAHGYDAGTGSVVDGQNGSSLNNTGYGFRAQYGSVVRATGATVSGNTSGSYFSRDGSVLFETGGGVSVLNVPTYSVTSRVYDTTKAAYYELAASSIGDLIFSAAATARFVMKADGTFHPSGDNTQTLGRAANRWSVVYAGTGSINTSDQTEKTPVRPLEEAEISAGRRLLREIGIFQWLASIQQKGDRDARLHVGMTVQRAIEVMQEEGLDPFRYGMICLDQWPDIYETVPAVYEKTGEFDNCGVEIERLVEEEKQVICKPAGQLYGFREGALHNLMLRAAAVDMDAMEARLSALEALVIKP